MTSKIQKLINLEKKRQNETIDLIASENYVSKNVLKALGSVFVNKYAEGYPKARYYAGNKIVDDLELYVKNLALKTFHVSNNIWSVNVQPYSGSPANVAVYLALVPRGERIMGLSLDMGGHLTHGHKASASGKLWEQIPYSIDRISETLDYGEILNIAKRERPKLIIAGYSAYSRVIDFKKFKMIADEVGAIFMVDMSHFSGLVAGGVYPSPFLYADVVTTTTHKTFRGPRAALIFSKKEFSQDIDKSVFPGLQGGPHMNQIAAMGVSLEEIGEKKFKKYAKQVVLNADLLASELEKMGWRIVSGGTDTHLFLVDVVSRGIGGKNAEEKLERNGIIVNKNVIPYDERNPRDPSGIRIGTPAVTTRGMKEREMKIIARCISNTLIHSDKNIDVKKEITRLCKKFPLL